MNRIEEKFKQLKEKGQKGLVTFITAGDPSLDGTIELVTAMEKGGADIVELGIPYSDPLADGPVIQASAIRALKNGIKIKDIMDTVKKIREISNIPLVYLVYYNSIFKYGIGRFLKDSYTSGIDGLIIPDLPVEEREDIIAEAGKFGIALIPLVAPTSKERIGKIARAGSGFVYCVSTAGVTGVRHNIETNIKEYMDIVSSYTLLPKALGFGISGPEMAKKFAPYCDGIIVGSAIVKIISEACCKEDMTNRVEKFVKDIKNAI